MVLTPGALAGVDGYSMTTILVMVLAQTDGFGVLALLAVSSDVMDRHSATAMLISNTAAQLDNPIEAVFIGTVH